MGTLYFARRSNPFDRWTMVNIDEGYGQPWYRFFATPTAIVSGPCLVHDVDIIGHDRYNKTLYRYTPRKPVLLPWSLSGRGAHKVRQSLCVKYAIKLSMCLWCVYAAQIANTWTTNKINFDFVQCEACGCIKYAMLKVKKKYRLILHLYNIDNRKGFIIPSVCNLLQSQHSKRLLLYNHNNIIIQTVCSNITIPL